MINTNDTVLLLTACVNPSGMRYTSLQDPQLRLRQYKDAINYYIKNTKYRIVVAENTGTDLSACFDKTEKGRIEFLTFEGNDYDKNLGKGYGEGVIINHALAHSRFLKDAEHIIKITGRHVVTNLNTITKFVNVFGGMTRKKMVSGFVYNQAKTVVADVFIASRSFYEDFLSPELKYCDDSKNVWFEHVLCKAFRNATNAGYRFVPFPCCVKQQGISGSTGAPFRNMSCIDYAKAFAKYVCYKTHILKL